MPHILSLMPEFSLLELYSPGYSHICEKSMSIINLLFFKHSWWSSFCKGTLMDMVNKK